MKVQEKREPRAAQAPADVSERRAHRVARAALEQILETERSEIYVLTEDGRLLFGSPAAQARRSTLGELGSPEQVQKALPGATLHWLPPMDGERFAVVRVPDAAQSDEEALEQARLSWKLTRRQAEVLALLAQGQSNRLIASALSCSERTVELHIASLFKKADCESRTALVAKFWRTRR
jgi:DNA-binding CsgD family transcriptional regulator